MGICVCSADASVCQYLHWLAVVATSLGLSGASDFTLGFGFKSRNAHWLTSISYLETQVVKINR